jgi:hypothetical protein
MQTCTAEARLQISQVLLAACAILFLRIINIECNHRTVQQLPFFKTVRLYTVICVKHDEILQIDFGIFILKIYTINFSSHLLCTLDIHTKR